jgi:putative ABC transport system permease protein
MKWLDAARTRLRLLLDRRSAESRMNQEFRFHIEMETELLMRAKGLAYGEARRQALVAFGGMEKHREELRDGRGFAWLGGLSLDLKLSARTLARYPGVTIVGGLALAIGIGLGAAYLELVNDILHPSLPLDEGERIVGLQNWDVAENDPEPRSLHDFAVWREQLKTVQHVGAFRSIERNLGTVDRTAEPALGAETSPSAFLVARVPALLGRPLVDDDERDAAPPAVVLGYDLWRDRFAGDPGVVGRPVQIGRSTSTVVGVMPEGFAFPVNHQFWVPLRARALNIERRQGPAIQIFGRLAPHATLEDANAEIGTIGLRTAADFPATHEHLRPRVVPYTELFKERDSTPYLVQVIFGLLLLVLASNVATMVFARTATREHEIAMRFALGSSRGRIVTQFFVEALVLALIATIVGLAVVAWGTNQVAHFIWDVTEGRIPFWLENSVSLNVTTVLYAIVLAVLGSCVAGVIPALKATQPRLQSRLRHPGGAGASALRFGGMWSAMIVVQVAFAVLVLPPAVVAVSGLAEADHTDPGFAAEEYLSAHLEVEADDFGEFQAAYEELRRRLLMNPEITRVTFATRLPGMAHPEPSIEVDADGNAPGVTGESVTASAVGLDYFDAFGAGIVAGRGFNSADLAPAAQVVVVNEYFVNEILQGRNAVGRRLRYSTRYGEQATTGRPHGDRTFMLEPGGWHEIVGVVKNLGMDTTRDAFTSGTGPGVYHPLAPDAIGSAGSYAVRIAFHVRGDAASFSPQLRATAHAVHPALRLYDVVTLDGPVDSTSRGQRRVGRFASMITALVAFVALLISIAGIYSVLSFTVARQTREIGIRMALGAAPRRVVAGVFSRAMIQIAAGIVVGAVIWFYVIVEVLGGGHRIGLLVTTAIVLMLVGLLACGVPVRRALRIEPTEALRDAG